MLDYCTTTLAEFAALSFFVDPRVVDGFCLASRPLKKNYI